MSINATLIIEVISFLILVFALSRFLYKPLLRILDERSNSVRQLLTEAESKRSEAEGYLKEAKERLDEAKEEALRIKAEMHKEIEQRRNIAMEEAKKEADRFVQQSKERLTQHIEVVKRQLKDEVVDIAIRIASKVLDREVKKEDHHRLLEEVIESLPDDRRGYSDQVRKGSF